MFAYGIVTLLIFVTRIRQNDGCAATSSASPATTASPVTTTASTDTTTTPQACASCTVSQITFTEANAADPNTETPTFTGPTTDANGCLELTAVCAAGNTEAFMQFNTNQGGPSEQAGVDVEATLQCQDGNWVYAPEGVASRIITEINCVVA
uniref:C6 domain-containing protein n=1 Tax=Panagrellus redivivus TaxID=6233 RepID=A0A7E4WDA0_PANRE